MVWVERFELPALRSQSGNSDLTELHPDANVAGYGSGVPSKFTTTDASEGTGIQLAESPRFELGTG